MGEYMYSSTTLNLSTRWRFVVSFTSLPLYPRRKIPRYPLNRRLVGPKAGLDAVEMRQISCPYREANVGGPTPRLVTIPTERSRIILYVILLQSEIAIIVIYNYPVSISLEQLQMFFVNIRYMVFIVTTSVV
jgi:hypothetical protein